MDTKKYWIGVLHSHLPFVKHPEYTNFLEEWWLFEAINETYIPLLMVFKRLEDDGIDFRLTVSLTPTLMEMFNDTHLMFKYAQHLDRLLKLGEKELIRTRTNYDEHNLARFYLDRFMTIKDFFYGFLDGNVLNGYRYFLKRGKIEIVTSAATHAFLPFIDTNEFVKLQIDVGKRVYEKHLGVKPNGIWIPECAYFTGLSKIIGEMGLNFFFVETHALDYDVAQTDEIFAFRRDQDTAKIVWSSKEGYPGDFNYRDFYRDLGFDMPLYYLKDILPGGIRTFTGYKYYKITGDTEYKDYYNPAVAQEKAKEHAYNFHFNLDNNLQYRLKTGSDLVVSLYDAELFGHWWFEGVDFLYHLFKVFDKYKQIQPITPSEYLSSTVGIHYQEPKSSSWGDKGFYDVWLNGSNSWIYNHLHHCEARLLQLFSEKSNKKEIVNQMIVELLLAQSSDWAFLITTKDNKNYATMREKEHIENFNKLDEMLRLNIERTAFFDKIKQKNSLFGTIDLYGALDRLRRHTL